MARVSRAVRDALAPVCPQVLRPYDETTIGRCGCAIASCLSCVGPATGTRVRVFRCPFGAAYARARGVPDSAATLGFPLPVPYV